MKKHYSLLCLLLLIFSCQQERIQPESKVEKRFDAIIDAFKNESKTALIKNNVVWSTADRLLIYEGSENGNLYQVSENSVGYSNGSFNLVGNYVSGNDFNYNLAVYPAELCSGLSSSQEGFSINMTIPSQQSFTQGSFTDDCFPMVALTKDLNDKVLRFKNVLGALKIRLKGDETITKMVLKGNAEEIISGEALVNIQPGNSKPVINMSPNGSKEIEIECNGGVTLSHWHSSDFIFSLPPVEFSQGFTVSIYLNNGEIKEIKTLRKNPVTRSTILSMPLCDVNGTPLDDPQSPTVEIIKANAVDVQIEAKLNGIEYFLGGCTKGALTNHESIVNEMNSIISQSDPTLLLNRNMYPYGFTGNPAEFFNHGKYSDFIPGETYCMYYIPYIEDKKVYTEKDVWYQEFTVPSPQSGGSLYLSETSVELTSESIAVTLASQGATAIYGKWVAEWEVAGVEGENLLNYLLSQEDPEFAHESNIRFETSTSLPGDSKTLLAIAIDSEGRSGNVFKQTYSSKGYEYNHLTVLSVTQSGDISSNGGYFEISFSEPVYGCICAVYNTRWYDLEHSLSSIERDMVFGMYPTYKYNLDTPSASTTIHITEQLNTTEEYALLVMATDAEGTYSHAGICRFSPSPSETDISGWGITGYFNNWNEDLWMVSDGNYLVYKNFTINTPYTESNTDPIEFKFRKDADWAINLGAEVKEHHIAGKAYKAVSYGSNIVLPDCGTYDIYLSKKLDKYYIMPTGEKPEDYVEN